MAFSDSFANTYGMLLQRDAMRAQELDRTEQRKLQREQLSEVKRANDLEMIKAGIDPQTMKVTPGGAQDEANMKSELAIQGYNAINNKLLAQDSDKAFLDYANTGDTKYLQNALNANQKLGEVWKGRGVHAVSNVDFNNDAKLLANAGFVPAEYDTPEKQSILKKNIYKTFDGQNWKLGLLNKAVIETGTATRVGEREAQVFENNYKELRDFLSGPKSSPNTAEGHKYEVEINDAYEATGVPKDLIAALLNQKNKEIPPNQIASEAMKLAKALAKTNGALPPALAIYKSDSTGNKSEINQFVEDITQNYANGLSYYNAGNEAVQTGKDYNLKQQVPERTDNQIAIENADNKIATIQEFVQGNALAAKGSSKDLAEREMRVAEETVGAAKLTALAKLKTEGTSSNQKDLAAAETAVQNMVNEFGGDEKFFKTDFSSDTTEGKKNFNKAFKYVTAHQKLTGQSFSEADKKAIADARVLTSLATKASKLTAEQTGLLDSELNNVKKLVSNHLKGVEAAAAYNALRNITRHAITGATLTEFEIKADEAAFGKLGNQLGPVLAQLKVSLAQIGSKLNSVATLGDPYVTKVLVGADREKIAKIQSNIQNRIDEIEAPTDQTTRKTDEEAKAIMDEIFR